MKKETYKSFQDYPTDIQKEAKKILNKEETLEYFKKVIGEVHLGDKTSIELILLSIGSLFVQNAKPVHQQIKGNIGSGKTSLLQKTLKIVPKRYVKTLNNVTPEYLYAKKDSFNSDYNIFLFDDIEPTKDTISLLNTLTDNKKENKVFIKSEKTELELQGKNLFFCIFTEKKIQNKKLRYRLLPNTISPGRKNKIEKNLIGGFDENSAKMRHLYCVINAIFEKLIEKPLKVLNPHLLDSEIEMFRYQEDFTRDVQHIIDLSKARSFFYQNQRPRVDDLIIGDVIDKKSVTLMLIREYLIRDYNLTPDQRLLIKTLREYSDELFEQHKRCSRSIQLCTKPENIPTYENIAGKIGITKDVLINWVKGKGSIGEDGLEKKGFVKPMKINPKQKTSKVLLYLNPLARYVRTALLFGTCPSYYRRKEIYGTTASYYEDPLNPALDTSLNKYNAKDVLDSFIMIENVENYEKAYKCRDKFMEENKLNIGVTDSGLAIYLKKFKSMYGSIL